MDRVDMHAFHQRGESHCAPVWRADHRGRELESRLGNGEGDKVLGELGLQGNGYGKGEDRRRYHAGVRLWGFDGIVDVGVEDARLWVGD